MMYMVTPHRTSRRYFSNQFLDFAKDDYFLTSTTGQHTTQVILSLAFTTMEPSDSSRSSNGTTKPNGQNKGINIKDALSILSARSKGGGEKLSSNSNDIPRELTEMGQTIDIMDQLEFTKTDAFKCECLSEDSLHLVADVKDNEQHEAMKQERLNRGKEIQSALQSLSLSELLGAIFAGQEERVATYKIFDQ